MDKFKKRLFNIQYKGSEMPPMLFYKPFDNRVFSDISINFRTDLAPFEAYLAATCRLLTDGLPCLPLNMKNQHDMMFFILGLHYQSLLASVIADSIIIFICYFSFESVTMQNLLSVTGKQY